MVYIGYGWDMQLIKKKLVSVDFLFFLMYAVLKSSESTKRTCQVWLFYLHLSGPSAAQSLGYELPWANVTFLFNLIT